MRLNNYLPSIMPQLINHQHGHSEEGSCVAASENTQANIQPQAIFSIPLKVTVGGRFFYPGIPKILLNDTDRRLLRSLLTPVADAFTNLDVNGILSYVASHHQPGFPPEIFLVSVDIKNNNCLSRMVASRLSDRSVAIDLGFEQDQRIPSAEKILNAIRKRDADKIQMAMIKAGSLWQWYYGQEITVKHLSKENIGRLRKLFPVQNLSITEKKFIEAFMSEPLYITHATPSDSDINRDDGSISLLSRKKLMERNIHFNQDNTSQDDIYHVASDDHVFFSLEAGEQPQKKGSRFGDTLYRFKFDQDKVLKYATLHLVDPLTGEPPAAANRFDVLENINNEDPIKSKEIIDSLDSRIYSPSEGIFHGKHMRIGLAMSIIETCRTNMPEEVKNDLLESESMNRIINGLFRPSVMVPGKFFGFPVDKKNIEKQ